MTALLSFGLGMAKHAAAADLGNIWLLGDSFTSGFTVAGAYRPELYADLSAAGDTFRFVGSTTVDSTPLLAAAGQDHHDGHSAILIANGTLPGGEARYGLYENVGDYYNATVATQGTPNIIVLMIGLNDLNSNVAPAGAPGRLDLLITRIMGLDPAAHLVVASVNPARQGNLYMDPGVGNLDASIRTYNASLPGIVTAHDALGQNVSFVDIYAALTLDDLGSDGLHPSAAGYIKMGDTFAAALAVPEPGTWCLLIAGFGLIALTTRRRAVLRPPSERSLRHRQAA